MTERGRTSSLFLSHFLPHCCWNPKCFGERKQHLGCQFLPVCHPTAAPPKRCQSPVPTRRGCCGKGTALKCACVLRSPPSVFINDLPTLPASTFFWIVQFSPSLLQAESLFSRGTGVGRGGRENMTIVLIWPSATYPALTDESSFIIMATF